MLAYARLKILFSYMENLYVVESTPYSEGVYMLQDHKCMLETTGSIDPYRCYGFSKIYIYIY